MLSLCYYMWVFMAWKSIGWHEALKICLLDHFFLVHHEVNNADLWFHFTTNWFKRSDWIFTNIVPPHFFRGRNLKKLNLVKFCLAIFSFKMQGWITLICLNMLTPLSNLDTRMLIYIGIFLLCTVFRTKRIFLYYLNLVCCVHLYCYFAACIVFRTKEFFLYCVNLVCLARNFSDGSLSLLLFCLWIHGCW